MKVVAGIQCECRDVPLVPFQQTDHLARPRCIHGHFWSTLAKEMSEEGEKTNVVGKSDVKLKCRKSKV